MHIGDAGVEEPLRTYLSFMRRSHTPTSPVPLRSDVSEKIVESGILATRTGATSLLEIEFDGKRRKEQMDFRLL
jgi:hypothetical protein